MIGTTLRRLEPLITLETLRELCVVADADGLNYEGLRVLGENVLGKKQIALWTEEDALFLIDCFLRYDKR